MGFDVFHVPSAAATGGVAFQGGRGKFLQFLSQQRLQKRQLDQADNRLRAQMQENQAGRNFQTDRDAKFQQFQFNKLREEQEIRQEDFDFKFTATQKNRMKQIQQDLEGVDQDDTLTPEQITKMAESLMREDQLAEFNKVHEMNLAYSISGVGRFRENIQSA